MSVWLDVHQLIVIKGFLLKWRYMPNFISFILLVNMHYLSHYEFAINFQL